MVLDPAIGKPVTVILQRDGSFEAEVGGAGKITAEVVFANRLVSLAPDPGNPGPDDSGPDSEPYRTVLGTVKPGAPNAFVLKGAKAAASNTFVTVADAAKVGHEVAGRDLPQVLVLGRFDKKFETIRRNPDMFYWDPEKAIYVAGPANSDAGDEWEPTPLAHEYGHHVLAEVAQPGPEAGGKHDPTLTYPQQPALPWSEGFANAFAAVALKDPTLEYDCDPSKSMDVGSNPAAPAPDKPHFAQYNETAIAGVIWDLAAYFGNGDRQKGLEILLAAWANHSVTGEPPRSLRDARDSLIAADLESTPEQHAEITKIFADHNIGWGLWLTFDHTEPIGVADSAVLFDVEGPLGGCRDAADWFGNTGADEDGGLPYTWHDNCRIGGASFSGQRTNEALYGFLYDPSASLSPVKYTISAQFVCEDYEGENACPGSISTTGPTYALRYADMVPLENTQGQDTSSYIRMIRQIEGGSFTLPRDQWVPVLEFDRYGNCTILIGNVDCSA